MKLFFVKADSGELVPWDDIDARYVAKLGAGETVEFTPRKVRNPAHHRKMMALVQRCFEYQNIYRNVQDFITEMKVAVGHYEEYITSEGQLVYLPKSMAFANMDQTEFDPFYKKCVVWMAERFEEPQCVTEANEIIAKQEAELDQYAESLPS